ncbi:MAG TPA: polysaccharide pyruvyl transferase family protein [Clostridia bacterium]|nr:polysaccharide pyruvyl transferase family protein [Clostridia bacterium]
MKKILIVGGSLQSENMGINALTRGLLNGIYEVSDNVQVKILSFVTNEKRNLVFVKNAKSFVIEEIPSSVKQNLKLLPGSLFLSRNSANSTNGTLSDLYSEADLILDLSAGDSFTDIYGIKRYIYTSLPKLVSIRLKKKLILMPQTFGPFNHRIVRAISRYIVNNSYMNYARDINSLDYLLKDLRTSKTRVTLVPDMAFNMPPAGNTPADDTAFAGRKEQAPLVGINISALLYNGGYTSKNQFDLKSDYRELVREVIGLFTRKNCNILLVPHVLCPFDRREDDYSLCKTIASETSEKYPYIRTFKERYAEDQIKAIIGKCDFFIGSRMHACIGAVSMGIPTVPVAYSRKFAGIWEKFGMKDCVADAKTMDIAEIIDKIERCFDNRKKIKAALNKALKDVREEIGSMFEFIMNC